VTLAAIENAEAVNASAGPLVHHGVIVGGVVVSTPVMCRDGG